MKGRVQIGLQGEGRLLRTRIFQIHEIKNVVVDTSGIVSDICLYFGRHGIDTDQQLFQGKRLVLRIFGQNVVQPVYIRLQVPVVVETHGLRIDIGLHAIIFIG